MAETKEVSLGNTREGVCTEEKEPPPPPPTNALTVGAPLGVSPVPLLGSPPGETVERRGGEGVAVEDEHTDAEPKEVWLRVRKGERVVVMKEEGLGVEESEDVTH